MMHKTSNAVYMDTQTFFNTNKFENEANAFAVNLLIPDCEIYDNKKLTTGQLSRLLGYEEAMIRLRLKSYQPENQNVENDI